MTQTTITNPATLKLIDRLKDWQIDPSDWYENCGNVNLALYEAGIENITLVFYSTVDDGSVHCSYFSKKIHETITLDSEVNTDFESVEDMAEQLMEYATHAAKLEAALPELSFNL